MLQYKNCFINLHALIHNLFPMLALALYCLSLNPILQLHNVKMINRKSHMKKTIPLLDNCDLSERLYFCQCGYLRGVLCHYLNRLTSHPRSMGKTSEPCNYLPHRKINSKTLKSEVHKKNTTI